MIWRKGWVNCGSTSRSGWSIWTLPTLVFLAQPYALKRVKPRIYALSACTPPRQPAKVRVIESQFAQMGGGIEKILGIRTAAADGAGDDPRLFLELEPAAILVMIGVDHVGHGLDLAAVLKPDRKTFFEVGRGDEFALAQIGQHRVPPRCVDREAEPWASRTLGSVECQDKARPFGRAAVMDAAHAEAARIARQGRDHLTPAPRSPGSKQVIRIRTPTWSFSCRFPCPRL